MYSMHDDDREIEGINMLSRFAEKIKTIENMTRADSASFMKNARKYMHATVTRSPNRQWINFYQNPVLVTMMMEMK